ALRAVFGNVKWRFTARDVLRGRVASAGGHDADRCKGRGRLVVTEAGTELGVKSRHPGYGRALVLARRHRSGAASSVTVIAFAPIDDWQQCHATQGGPVASVEFADANFADAFKALGHDLHIGVHDGIAESPELLHVLFANDFTELLGGNAELGKKRR